MKLSERYPHLPSAYAIDAENEQLELEMQLLERHENFEREITLIKVEALNRLSDSLLSLASSMSEK